MEIQNLELQDIRQNCNFTVCIFVCLNERARIVLLILVVIRAKHNMNTLKKTNKRINDECCCLSSFKCVIALFL